MGERFTEKASYAIRHSAEIAGELGHTYIGSEHLMLSLLECEHSVTEHIFKKHGITASAFKKAVCDYSGTGVESCVGAADMTPRCRKILERSHHYSEKFGYPLVGTEHMLYALLEERDCIAMRLLKSIGVNSSAIKEELLYLFKAKSAESSKKSDAPTLKQYGKNFTELAKNDKFDPVIGRERETERLIRVLCRKNKNNPCLIGEAGVGKSAIVEGLAMRIARGDVPPMLRGASIISVDLTSMVAGAKYRGDFEERIKNMVSEASRNRSIILFIDEIHTIVGAGAAEGAIDASNILKPQLSRGELQVIGATTFSEYRKYIERDPALERRFQPIVVEEPDEDETARMLMGVKSRYEEHHGVSIDRSVVKACVELSVKYINDRFLPDKAIDVMDESCAYAASKMYNGLNFANINENTRQNAENDLLTQYLSGTLLQLDTENVKASDTHFPPTDVSVSVEDVRYVISEISGIDISDVTLTVDYEKIESDLMHIVFGQEAVIKSMVAALKRARLGLSRQSRPLASFLLIGESGVGKTALAQALSEVIFQSNNAILRYDMSEYSEKHSVAKLLGAPPGYAGYDDGGALTEAVRKKPHAVVLFDEIEKADREVQNLFLQIADNGYLTDSSGRKISFRNTIVIMTSNVGYPRSGSSAKLGFLSANSDEKAAEENLRRYFSAEFVNRFDEILYFASLSDETLGDIAAARLDELVEMLKSKNTDVTYSDSVVKFIVSKTRGNKMGARGVLRYIASSVENVIYDFLEEYPSGGSLNLVIRNGNAIDAEIGDKADSDKLMI